MRRRNSAATAVNTAVTARSLPPLGEVFQRISSERHVALAVSGGSDSLALMHMAAEWRGKCRAPCVSVVTVDHGLRPASRIEAGQVANWSAELGFPHQTLTWNGDKPKTGLQAKARQARYDLMADWCCRHGASVLLTAHTMDDQAETVAMRLSRTSTAASLSAVWPERPWGGVQLHRPLLGVRREELRDYLRGKGVAWIEDPSNSQTRFERVRVRRQLEASPELVPGLAEMASAAAAEINRRQDFLRGWLRSKLQWNPAGYATVDRGAFSKLGKEQQADVTAHLLAEISGRSAAPHSVAALAEWVRIGEGRRSLGGVLFSLRRASLLAGREPGRISPAAVPVPASGRLDWDHRFEISARLGCRVMPAVSLGKAAGPHDAPHFVRQGWPVIFDEKGEFPEAGVRFKPCLR